MHTRDLVELAALVAVHGPLLIRNGRVSESGLEQYWAASKTRLDNWTRSLKDYSHSQQNSAEFAANEAAAILAWRSVKPVLEEILTAEVLTRVWTAVACGYDRDHRVREVEPVVRSVYTGHLESRNKALNLMVYGRGFNTQEAVELNRLRRRCERWTDMLLGYVFTDPHAADFAFEPQRTRDFAADVSSELNRPLGAVGRQLVISALRSAFRGNAEGTSTNEDLNQQIAGSILSCFRGDLFDSTGLLKSLWIDRLEHTASDTVGMIEDLLQLDDEASRIPSDKLMKKRF